MPDTYMLATDRLHTEILTVLMNNLLKAHI